MKDLPGKCAPACCGPSRSGASDRAYFDRFVDRWMDTPVGSVAHVETKIGWRDTAGRWIRRWGIGRDAYRVAPGLFAVGDPGPDSRVFVTANYKMTFDALRRELGGLDAWLLVLDTGGVNVWCAAGKGTFGTDEIVKRVTETGLAGLVSHRTLILPQLGAPGVRARDVRQGCGFGVIYGPVRARDIRPFLGNGLKATQRMRTVTFTAAERLALTPVELVGFLKPTALAALVLFLLAGVGPAVFSPPAAWQRGIGAVWVWIAGVLGGALLTPLLLPWIPGRAFSAKGAQVGAALACLAAAGYGTPPAGGDGLALLLALTAVSSFAAMNFTGATPFTSPSGVEKEMRRAVPLQASAAALAAILWVGGAFVG